MLKVIFSLIFFILMNQSSFGFVARIIDSNKNSCEEQTDINLAVGCFQGSSLTDDSSGSETTIGELSQDVSQIGNLILPLEFARKKSLAIVDKTSEQKKKIGKFKKDLESGVLAEDSKDFKDHREHFQVLLGLEYKLAQLEGTLPKCTKGRGVTKAAFEKCQEKREEKREMEGAPNIVELKNQINEEYARFPLLQERSIQEELKERVDERLNNSETGNLTIYNELKRNYNQCKSNTRRSRTRSKKKKKDKKPSCDDRFKQKIADAKTHMEKDLVFPLEENKERELFLGGLKTASETVDEVIDRHQKTADKITKGFDQFNGNSQSAKRTRSRGSIGSLSKLHSSIFQGTSSETLNRLTEYQLSIDPRLIEDDPTYRFAACKIAKERDANELNDQIQSYALDAATLLIPFGGAYFVSAKALAKIAKAASSVDKAKKIVRGRQLMVAATEAAVATVDVTNLNAKAEYCKSIENKNLAFEESNDKLKQMQEECKAVLDDHTLSTSLAVLGGGLGTAFGVIGASNRSLKQLDILERKKLADAALGKDSDISIAQATAVEEAHLVGIGQKGVDGTPARVGNYTKAQLREKSRILKAAGFSKDEVRTLVEGEVVGLRDLFRKKEVPAAEIASSSSTSRPQSFLNLQGQPKYDRFRNAFNRGEFTEETSFVSLPFQGGRYPAVVKGIDSKGALLLEIATEEGLVAVKVDDISILKQIKTSTVASENIALRNLSRSKRSPQDGRQFDSSEFYIDQDIVVAPKDPIPLGGEARYDAFREAYNKGEFSDASRFVSIPYQGGRKAAVITGVDDEGNLLLEVALDDGLAKAKLSSEQALSEVRISSVAADAKQLQNPSLYKRSAIDTNGGLTDVDLGPIRPTTSSPPAKSVLNPRGDARYDSFRDSYNKEQFSEESRFVSLPFEGTREAAVVKGVDRDGNLLLDVSTDDGLVALKIKDKEILEQVRVSSEAARRPELKNPSLYQRSPREISSGNVKVEPPKVSKGNSVKRVIDESESVLVRSKLSPATNKELNKLGLSPKTAYRAPDGSTIYLSERFKLGSRDSYVAFVEKNGKMSTRIIYKSNSQGVFRWSDGISAQWYSKGPGEDFMSLPPDLQRRLLIESNDPTPVQKLSSYQIEGLDRTNPDYMALSTEYARNGNQTPQIKGVFESYSGSRATSLPPYGEYNRVIDNPATIQINPGKQPNFTKPIETYTTNTAVAGKVDAEVYQSADGTLTYTIFKDKEGKIWISDVYDNSGRLNQFGIPDRQIDLGDLATPRWEYNSQIHPMYSSSVRNSEYNNYSSNWNYVREIPAIQDYYRSRGIAIPPKDQ